MSGLTLKPRSRSHSTSSLWVARSRPLDRADPVAPDRERPFGGERRVELADRAGGRVARVGEGRLARLGAALVQRLEGGDRQVDLAAHLDQRRRVLDAQRDRPDRAQVLGHVLADPAVAAGGAADEHAVLVGERDRQAVDLRLGRVAELGGADVEPLQVVADAGLPGAQLLLVAGVGEREHRLGVLDLREALQRRRPDPLGRRVGRAQLRVLGLDRAQLVEQRVVFVVADLGVVEDVVAVVVAAQLAGAARPPASRRPSLTPPGGAGRQHLLEAPAAQPLEAAVVGEVEVDRRDRDPALGDRRQVGPLDLLVARLPAVDLVAAAAVLGPRRSASARRCRSRLPSFVTSTPVGSPAGQLTLISVASGIGSASAGRPAAAAKAAATPKSKRPLT